MAPKYLCLKVFFIFSYQVNIFNENSLDYSFSVQITIITLVFSNFCHIINYFCERLRPVKLVDKWEDVFECQLLYIIFGIVVVKREVTKPLLYTSLFLLIRTTVRSLQADHIHKDSEGASSTRKIREFGLWARLEELVQLLTILGHYQGCQVERGKPGNCAGDHMELSLKSFQAC